MTPCGHNFLRQNLDRPLRQAGGAVLFLFLLFSGFSYLCRDGYASNLPLNPRFVKETFLSVRRVEIDEVQGDEARGDRSLLV